MRPTLSYRHWHISPPGIAAMTGLPAAADSDFHLTVTC